MKLNKKIIVPALSLLAGASLIGSVSGTVAWYQYSTRANVSYIGSSAGVTGNLQVRIADATNEAGEWGPQIRTEDVLDYLESKGRAQKVEPVTPGALERNGFLKELEIDDGVAVQHGEQDPADAVLNPSEDQLYVKVVEEEDPVDPVHNPHIFTYSLFEYAPDPDDIDADPWLANNEIAINPTDDVKNSHKDDAKFKFIDTSDFKLYSKKIGDAKDFYLNPVFGNGPYSKWRKADKQNYVKIPLQLQFIDGADLKAQDIYLSKLLIQKDRTNGTHGDISEAIRVHFSAYEDGDEINAINHLVSKKGGSTATGGRLKIGNGSDFDKAYQSVSNPDDVWGFEEDSVYDYVQYGEGSQNSYGAVIDDGSYYNEFHNYYEGDESNASSKSWENVASTNGTADMTSDDGNPGDFYIKKVNVGAQNESRELYQKKPDVWKKVTDESIIKSGTALPTADLGCTYFLRTNGGAFYRLYKYENSAWAEETSIADFDSEEPVILDGLRLDKANKALMRGEKDVWALVDASKYEHKKDVDLSSKPLTEKADGYVEHKYYIDSNDKLYEFVGGIFKEKIDPVLAKEVTDSLALDDLTEDKVIAKTSEGHVVNVDVTIWVEGWHKFANTSGKFSSIWESKYINSVFDVGMQFAVQDLNA